MIIGPPPKFHGTRDILTRSGRSVFADSRWRPPCSSEPSAASPTHDEWDRSQFARVPDVPGRTVLTRAFIACGGGRCVKVGGMSARSSSMGGRVLSTVRRPDCGTRAGIFTGRVLRDAPLRARSRPVPLQYQVPHAGVARETRMPIGRN